MAKLTGRERRKLRIRSKISGTTERPRLKPAAALLKLARANLIGYPATFHDLNVAELLATIDHWLGELEQRGYTANPLAPSTAPALRLIE